MSEILKNTLIAELIVGWGHRLII